MGRIGLICALLGCSVDAGRGGASFSGPGIGEGEADSGAETTGEVEGAESSESGFEETGSDTDAEAPTPAECGDLEVDDDEECDGDRGCDDGCRWSDAHEVFRVRKLVVLDPPIRNPGECSEITNLANAAINSALNNDADGGGYLDLAPLLEFFPVRRTHPTGHIGVATGLCTADDLVCRHTEEGSVSEAQYGNLQSGTCFEAAPAELAPGAAVPPTEAPCFIAQSTSIMLDFNPFPLQLQSGSVAGRFQGDPADRIVDGLLRGFLLESSACNPENKIASGYPIVGGHTLGELLAGAPLDCGGCQGYDDTDAGPNGERGWWFYASFEAERVAFEEE